MKRGKDDKISFHNLNLHRVAFVWEILNGWGKIKINDHLSPTEAEIGAEFGNTTKLLLPDSYLKKLLVAASSAPVCIQV